MDDKIRTKSVAVAATCTPCTQGLHASAGGCKMSPPGGGPCGCPKCAGQAAELAARHASTDAGVNWMRAAFTPEERRALRYGMERALGRYHNTESLPAVAWRRLLLTLDAAMAPDVAVVAGEILAAARKGGGRA